jgi:hypothetical protein
MMMIAIYIINYSGINSVNFLIYSTLEAIITTNKSIDIKPPCYKEAQASQRGHLSMRIPTEIPYSTQHQVKTMMSSLCLIGIKSSPISEPPQLRPQTAQSKVQPFPPLYCSNSQPTENIFYC